ncbi:MAG: hypothetical protein KatS3mg010_0323 [Acidimicrobiia bacterium]|nr:MAG: hypothetical protein KatS3mg010_0323 [Acidimicrobiia bacterium]
MLAAHTAIAPRWRPVCSPHAATAIARNTPASGLESPAPRASATAAVVDRRSTTRATSANVAPSANARRPTTRFASMPTANAAAARVPRGCRHTSVSNAATPPVVASTASDVTPTRAPIAGSSTL